MSGGITSVPQGPMHPMIVHLPNPGYLDTSTSSPSKASDAGDAGGSPTDKFMTGGDAVVSDSPIANVVDVAESSDSANANLDKKMVAYKIETLRVQGQALSSMAQALLMQIEALNTQVGSM